MFTGIIQAQGNIVAVEALGTETVGGGFSLRIAPGLLDMTDVAVGDSIAVNGVCLTVTSLHDLYFTVDVSAETVTCTWGLDKTGQTVNLEKAMRLSDRLGGHLVSGHVDATGEVTQFEPVGENFQLTIRLPKPLRRYVTRKGSIAVNGVSLTVNAVINDEFSINLIPHTLMMTNLRELKPGMPVNLETDMLARYVENLLQRSEA